MNAFDILSKRKNNVKLTQEEIDYFIEEYMSNNITDNQMAAFLMATQINGITDDETAWLTNAMAYSGKTINTSSIENLLDKHSTGGVGDKTTFLIVAMLAALGYKLGLMSGRGLGHTGGTIDKMESIPCISASMDDSEYLESIESINCAIIEQTEEIAPADKRMYALRNQTSTIDSIPLIAASIMSKKIASGTQNIVLDVKYGSSAFMKTKEEAELLANTMVTIATNNNIKAVAHITESNDILGNCVGNAIELRECIDILSGVFDKGTEELIDLSVKLSIMLVKLIDPELDEDNLKQKLISTLTDGTALAAFDTMFVNQGMQSIHLKEELDKQQKHLIQLIRTDVSGVVEFVNVERIGMILAELGSNRLHPTDEIDHLIGLKTYIHIGDVVNKNDAIAELEYTTQSQDEINCAIEELQQCWTIAKQHNV